MKRKRYEQRNATALDARERIEAAKRGSMIGSTPEYRTALAAELEQWEQEMANYEALLEMQKEKKEA